MAMDAGISFERSAFWQELDGQGRQSMRYELRLIDASLVGNVRGPFILARFSLTFCPQNDISASKLIWSLIRSIFCEEELHEALQHLRPGSSLFRRASVPKR
jgi:hypothetical protein